MIDSYNRDINYIRVSITDRCNLRCKYCMPKEGVSLLGHNDILRYEEILRIVHTAVQLGIVKVRVTGGEPLVRRGVLEFLKSLKQIEGLREVTLTTNGMLLEECAEGLFEAGIRRVNISLDSLDPEKYHQITRGGDLAKVLRGISLAGRIGFHPIKINVVVIKGYNENEIADFAAISCEKPYQIRFIELMSLGPAVFGMSDGILNQIVMDRIRSKYDLIAVSETSPTDGPANVFRIKGALGEIGFIDAGNRHLCRTCNRMRLTADGHLRSCLLSDNEVDIKSALRSGCNDAELKDIIGKAIASKSESHGHSTEEMTIKKCVKPMSAIGG
jgi:GTP 3',8-cyclase